MVLEVFRYIFKLIWLNRQQPGNIEIMVGTNLLNDGGTYYKTEKFITHESYNRPSFAYDIAVLKIQGEIEFNDKVQPIALLADEVPDGAELQLTGWGTLVVSVVFFPRGTSWE